ncbi:hypothetical protein KOY_01234 [Bacillus cereus VDM021]|nr:hypothetical protein IIW_02910 [Bacillus cereus VD136]EOP66858.1 hypothetical protein KOW_01637 [Bacillus cereus VDM006]EOQ03384.1 hypothetical protein KOY_01234 [Bacillus cereus VDM021]
MTACHPFFILIVTTFIHIGAMICLELDIVQ